MKPKLIVEYSSFIEVSDSDIRQLAEMESLLFAHPFSQEKIRARLVEKKFALLCTATCDERLVGFKLGYEETPEAFYSWIGGVLPDFRGQGIATQLMKLQHQLLSARGYAKVVTKSQNAFAKMICLNLKNGFRIIATTPRPDHKDLDIYFEKQLSSNRPESG